MPNQELNTQLDSDVENTKNSNSKTSSGVKILLIWFQIEMINIYKIISFFFKVLREMDIND